ncbi:MAG: ABC transporter ATP-binding protein [Peptococcaceae bacterium]|jgi:lipopolysaccharide transport system ATP-binding protein|nr:ABC transporter ATP-binding protein [Peptococcaceae bacterium]
MNIKLSNVTRYYRKSLFDVAISVFRDALYKKPVNIKTNRIIKAVDNVTLDINPGERVGIIGENGAGKTTLLQMIAGFLKPSHGIVEVEGRVNCIMSLATGIRDDVSGRENIYINGELNGKSRLQVNEIINEVIEFAELGEFIDYPVRTYSTGMKARLAFAMNIDIDPEILIIDEALSVGDARFTTKAFDKMKEICQKGHIVIVVSHSMPSIVALCNRCIWMEKGKVIMDGDPKTVTAAYLQSCREKEEKLIRERYKERTMYCPGDKVRIESINFYDKNGLVKNVFEVGECINTKIEIVSHTFLNPDIIFSLRRIDGLLISQNSMRAERLEINLSPGKNIIDALYENILLGKGIYEAVIEVKDIQDNGIKRTLTWGKELFKINNHNYPYENPIYFYPESWSIEELEEDQ